MTIEWSVSPHHKQALTPTVKSLTHRLPTWLHTLFITTSDADDYASITAHPEYRTAYLHLHPRFWELSPPQQRETVAHEFAHIILAPMDDVFARLRECVTHKALGDWADEAYRIAGEGVATDLARTFVQ